MNYKIVITNDPQGYFNAEDVFYKTVNADSGNLESIVSLLDGNGYHIIIEPNESGV